MCFQIFSIKASRLLRKKRKHAIFNHKIFGPFLHSSLECIDAEMRGFVVNLFQNVSHGIVQQVQDWVGGEMKIIKVNFAEILCLSCVDGSSDLGSQLLLGQLALNHDKICYPRNLQQISETSSYPILQKNDLFPVTDTKTQMNTQFRKCPLHQLLAP